MLVHVSAKQSVQRCDESRGPGISQAIEDLLYLAPAFNDASLAQFGKLLRE